MSEYEPDEEKRDLSDDIRGASDAYKKAKDLKDKTNKIRDKFKKDDNQNNGKDGQAANKANGNTNQSGGASSDKGAATSGNGAQAGGDVAANSSSASAPGGDLAAGASGSGSASEAAGAGSAASNAAAGGEAAAGGGAAAGGAAAGGAAAGGAAAGGAAAGSAAAAGGAAASGAAAGGAAAAAPVIGIVAAVIGCILLVMFLLNFLLYVITLPSNVLLYSADAVGEGVTSWAENVGQDLSVAKYNFMIDMYDMSSNLENFAFHILHPGQAAATDEILSELEANDIALASDNFAPEYTNTTNSIVTTLDGAFRKGWARTAQTAEYRANQIVATTSIDGGTSKITDKYDDEELWNSEDDYWSKTDQWKRGDDYYIAGTFTKAPNETYQNECTHGKTTITTSIVPDMDADGIPDNEDDDVSQTCYMDAIMKIIALQNCAEQAVLVNNDVNGDISQYGVDATYTDDALVGDDNASAEAKMKSTEYQLLRLAGEIAGRGIQRQDLNTDKEQDSIYQIVTTTEIKDSTTVHNVLIKYKTGTHEEYTLDEDGNIQYDSNGDAITHTVDDYGWKHDHYDVCLHVNVQTTYSVVLRADAKDIIAEEMAKSLSDEEKEAFYTAIDDYYDMQYQLLCKMYNLDAINGGSNIAGGGGYQPGMTPEEIEALLNSLNLDPASARGQLVQVALASCGKYTYNQSNGFRDGVNSGLFSPGNVNYTGTQFDCSSFVQYCYFMAGIPLSPTSTHGYASAIASGELIEITADQVLPGDLQVVYPTNSYEGHVWMYVGDGNWCECTPDGGVRADNWSKNFMTTHTSHYVRSVFLQGG